MVTWQVRATANWAGPVWCFFFGGINYQIEHHLFPTISHVHYPAIAPIVRETATEFGLRYVAFDNVIDGLANVLEAFRAAQASHEPVVRQPKGLVMCTGLHAILYKDVVVVGALLVGAAAVHRRQLGVNYSVLPHEWVGVRAPWHWQAPGSRKSV